MTPERIREIAHQLRTQDNRITTHPIFMVQERIGKRWQNVMPCFTEVGARDYIRASGYEHIGDLRIFVASAYRNAEWRAIREWLMEVE